MISKPAMGNMDESKVAPNISKAPWAIYNIGSSKPYKLTDYIEDLVNDFDYKLTTSLQNGMKSFVAWYKGYHQLKT